MDEEKEKVKLIKMYRRKGTLPDWLKVGANVSVSDEGTRLFTVREVIDGLVILDNGWYKPANKCRFVPVECIVDGQVSFHYWDALNKNSDWKCE